MGGTLLSSHRPRWARAQLRAAFAVFGIARPPTRQDKSRPLTFPIEPVALPQVLWQARPLPVVQSPNREDDHGNLCRAGEFHRAGNSQRQGVAEARGSLQGNGEDVRSDSEGNCLDTAAI